MVRKLKNKKASKEKMKKVSEISCYKIIEGERVYLSGCDSIKHKKRDDGNYFIEISYENGEITQVDTKMNWSSWVKFVNSKEFETYPRTKDMIK